MIILTAFGDSLYSSRETYNARYLTEKAEAHLCRPHNGQQVGAEIREVPKKKAGSWLREQRQKAGLSQWTSPTSWGSGTTPSFPRSKMALVGFRPKVWETGHGHLAFGLRSLLAFCSVTTIQRYSMSCSRMERNERGLPGCRSEERASGNAERWSPAEMGELRVSITLSASKAVPQGSLMARRTTAIRNSTF